MKQCFSAQPATEQTLAADGAIAWFASNSFPFSLDANRAPQLKRGVRPHIGMRVKGRITEWNDLRGFGFISPLEGGERVFFHVSAFHTGSRRPTEGEFVSYTLGTDERGRVRATQVTYVVTHAKRAAVQTQARNASLIAGCVAAAFLGVVTLLAIGGRLWWPTPCVYIVASIMAYFAYKHDKEAAQVGARRTNEWTLITLGLIGGWPGALVARHRFRHKTSKIAFRVGYWLSVGLNVAGLAWLIAP